jgi:hypothetical protein
MAVRITQYSKSLSQKPNVKNPLETQLILGYPPETQPIGIFPQRITTLKL